jgi:hypothetical protein
MILDMVLQNNYSFDSLKSLTFTKMVKLLKSDAETPTPFQIKALLQSRAEKTRQKIKEELTGNFKVSLSLDAWTSPNRYAFLAIVAHYIDDNWKLKELLIGFEVLYGKHTGQNMASAVYEVLKQYDIHNRLFAVTTDNAANNNTMSATLATMIGTEETKFGVQFPTLNNMTDFRLQHSVQWENNALHIPCLAHVLQLVVGSFLSGIKGEAESSSVLRDVVSKKDITNSLDSLTGFQRTLSKVSQHTCVLTLWFKLQISLIFKIPFNFNRFGF